MKGELGEARRTYKSVEEPILLQPLGAYGWVSDTGFLGVNVLFYRDGGGGDVYRASMARPTRFFGNDPRRLMSAAISDYVEISVHDLAHGAFEFHNAKVSADLRLSIHKDLGVEQGPYLGARAYDAFTVANWVELVERLRGLTLDPVSALTQVYAFVSPARYGAVQVDETRSVASLPLFDNRGAEMVGHIDLRPENNFLVDNLIALFGEGARAAGDLCPDALFGRAWVEGGRLRFFPYTAVFERPVVLAIRGARRRVNEVHLSLEAVGSVSRGGSG
jgi:hypothetical protein